MEMNTLFTTSCAAIFGIAAGFILKSMLTKSAVSTSSSATVSSESEGKKVSRRPVEPGAEHKLVLVVRTDLGMGKGKIAAQCSHATLGCYKKAKKHQPDALEMWENNSQPKIVVKCNSEDEMYMAAAQAESLGLITCIIQDAGRTQIARGSSTVLGVGPGLSHVIDNVTGHMKLM